MYSNIRVALLDDHEVVQHGITNHLARSPSISVVGCCSESGELLDLLSRMPVDVLLLDYALARNDLDGLVLVRLLAARYPELRVLLVSANESEPMLAKAKELGVSGFFSKTQDLAKLPAAIEAIANGERYWPEQDLPRPAAGPQVALTTREMEVIRCCLDGLSVTEIAAKYRRSIKTISTQKRSAYKKLGIQHDTELFKYQADLARGEGSE